MCIRDSPSSTTTFCRSGLRASGPPKRTCSRPARWCHRRERGARLRTQRRQERAARLWSSWVPMVPRTPLRRNRDDLSVVHAPERWLRRTSTVLRAEEKGITAESLSSEMRTPRMYSSSFRANNKRRHFGTYHPIHATIGAPLLAYHATSGANGVHRSCRPGPKPGVEHRSGQLRSSGLGPSTCERRYAAASRASARPRSDCRATHGGHPRSSCLLSLIHISEPTRPY